MHVNKGKKLVPKMIFIKGGAQWVECLPGIHQALPRLKPEHPRKLKIIVYACNPNTREVETGRSEARVILIS